MADRPSTLDVLLGGVHVARLHQEGRLRPIRCEYTEAALQRWPGNTPVLSCSLPLMPRMQDPTPFLEGLLPEGEARALIAADLRVVASDAWMLLVRLGRDVAGAVQVVPVDRRDVASAPDVDPYTEEELEEAVARLPSRPLDIRDDSELSLAGIQNKMTLVALPDGAWGRPVGGYPSTHILKVEDRRFPGLAELEAAALRLAADLGLSTVEARTVDVGGLPCLIVSRYDRRIEDGTVVRIHQEDLCQALAIDPTRSRGGQANYERNGGPALRDAATLLRRFAADVQHEVRQLFRAMVFTVVIGNADAHGKNLSLLHPEPGRIELAPLYDTVPTALFDQLPRRCAMSVNGVMSDLASITAADLISEVVGRSRWGLTPATARELLDEVLVDLGRALEEGVVTGRLAGHVAERSRQLRDQLTAA